ncbi:MAG: M48 family metallopeptidase, partial [Candidatus Omnitrophica bacterium]|nr:M48 family metallopeptidase [Candidatus Omnitrophota bacterium]
RTYTIIPLYILSIYVGYYILNFPLIFYRSYSLEHKFSLSNQRLRDWFLDQVKSGLISYIVGLVLVGAFYFILDIFGNNWWLVVSIFWIFVSLALAKLLPVAIIPLFFKHKKLSDQELRARVIRLAEKMKVKVLDVFEIDFSKKTLKANAAFVGIGRTRRVILADTLKEKYSDDEIEVILAHEFAHYRLRHLLKLVLINSVATLFTFYLIYKTGSYVLGIFGFKSFLELAALPIVLIYFVLFGIVMQPLQNYLSRVFEIRADKTALEVTGLKDAFISMMDKLASQNLADRNPHPIIKFFFFDHPPIDERIALARQSKFNDS